MDVNEVLIETAELKMKVIAFQNCVIESALASACTYWDVSRSDVKFERDSEDPYKITFNIGKGSYILSRLDVIDYITLAETSKYTAVELLETDLTAMFFNAIMRGWVECKSDVDETEPLFTNPKEDK